MIIVRTTNFMLFIQSLLAGLFSVFSMGEPGFYADVLLPTDEGIARDWEAVGGDVLPGVYHYGQGKENPLQVGTP